MKVCTKCNKEKDGSKFYCKKRNKDGLRAECKDCSNIVNKVYKASLHGQAVVKTYRSTPEMKTARKIYHALPKVKKSRGTYERNRIKRDPVFRLKKSLRSRFYQAFKKKQKAGSAVKDLGCTGFECKLYLETLFYPHPITGELMTWDNYGTKWQIDHIVEFNSIDITDRIQLLAVLHYTNLQPLWTEDHDKKSKERFNK